MRAIAAGTVLGILLAGASAWTHGNPPPQTQNPSAPQPANVNVVPDYNSIYCSNFITSDHGKDNAYLISGEESENKLVFVLRDVVSISKGSNQGVRVGDRYSVFREESDPLPVKWFKWQTKLSNAMGTYYRDLGELKVVHVEPNVSLAEVVHNCNYLQRGDLIAPWQDRPTPPYKPAEAFDKYAPVSGKSVGMIVYGKTFSQLFGKLSTVYVNLGTNQGVHAGDYLRIFRYQGQHSDQYPSFEDVQYSMYGFGATPVRYQWNDLPRDVLGEGIVLNVGPNSSTMLITLTRRDLYAGDYVEIE